VHTFLKASIVSISLLGLSACIDTYTVVEPTPNPDIPVVPEASKTVFQDECISESECIINKNIQNLLCNSVHHAEMNQLDQAAKKLEIVKYDKLPKSLDKNEITQEQFTSLDGWIDELTTLLYNDIVTYAEVEDTFPFSCAGITEQTAAVDEVVEQGIVDNNSQANAFLEKVCQSIFASEDHKYVQSSERLTLAGFIAIDMLFSNSFSSDEKQQLIAWINQISTTLIFQPAQYSKLKGPLHCELYSPAGADGIIGTIDDIIGSIF
jgi:hypothetical protein